MTNNKIKPFKGLFFYITTLTVSIMLSSCTADKPANAVQPPSSSGILTGKAHTSPVKGRIIHSNGGYRPVIPVIKNARTKRIRPVLSAISRDDTITARRTPGNEKQLTDNHLIPLEQ